MLFDSLAIRTFDECSGTPLRSAARNGSARFGSKPSLCFVSETSRADRPLLDPSVRYRCYHPAESLSSQGYRVTVCSASAFFAEPSYDYDAYVFHRPSASRDSFDRVIDRLQSLGRTAVADYDDLIFGDDEVALGSPAIKNGTMTFEVAIRTFGINQRALERFDRFSVSTAPLAERVRAIRPDARIEVVSNELPGSILRPHLDSGTAFRKRSSTVIGYFAGTRSHNADFPIVKEVLHRILSEDAKKTLLVVGPVELPYSLASLPNVFVRAAVPYWRLPELMTACETAIAPLESTEFNRCKSRVKFLEAAIAGCRLVATPIPDMAEVGSTRISLAQTPDEWYEALSFQPGDDDRQALIRENVRFLAQRTATAALQALGGF